MRYQVSLAAAIVLLGAWGARADSWKAPETRVVRSPDKKLTAKVVPADQRVKPRKPARVEVTYPDGAVKRFELKNPWAPVDVVLLNDGSLLTFDQWHSLGLEEVITRYDAAGTVLWGKKLEQLLKREQLKGIPRSVSSRWWRQGPLEWGLTETGAVWVTLWNEDRLEVGLASGAAKVVAVPAERLTDPKRLLRRGKALTRSGQVAGAVPVLHRVLKLQPGSIDGHRALAEAYRILGEHSERVAILKQAVARNPVEQVEPSSSGWTSDQRLWIRLELARAYQDGKRETDAVKTLEALLKLDPSFWAATQTLARIHLRANRRAKADELLEAAFQRRCGDPNKFNAAYQRTRAALDIGQVYENQRLWPQARDFYLRALKGAKVDYFSVQLVRRLVKVYTYNKETGQARALLESWIERMDDAIQKLPANRRQYLEQQRERLRKELGALQKH